MIRSYKELIVWQKSIRLVADIYTTTQEFPKAEMYGMVSQMRRCAVSIPSNIAEGFSRGHSKEYIRFLRVSFGSGAELETQIIIAKQLGFAGSGSLDEAESLLEEIMKMLNKLISTLVANS